MLTERLPLLPPMRWRLAEVPFGLDYPYWVDDPDFDLDFHVRELALPAPGTDEKLAEQVARIFARPLDRARPLWELYLIHGLEGGLVAMLTKIHHAAIDGLSGAEIMGVLFDLQPAGRELPDAGSRGGDRQPGELEMLARGVLGLPRYPLRALRSLPGALPNLDETAFGGLPGAEALARTSERVRRAVRGQREGGELERAELPAAADLVQRPHLTAPPVRLRPALARRGQGGQEPLRLHGQRRRGRDLHRRRAPLAGLARRAPGRSPGRPDPGLGAQREPAGHLRQPDHADERAGVHQRRPIRSSACG